MTKKLYQLLTGWFVYLWSLITGDPDLHPTDPPENDKIGKGD